MEAPVRNPRIGSRIGPARSSTSHAVVLRLLISLRKCQGVGNGIFRCRDPRLKFTSDTAIVLERPGNRKNGQQHPAQTASFRSIIVCEVREDWVVETEGTELPNPLAVMSNQSLRK